MSYAIELFSWNPRRPLLPGRLARYSRVRGRVNNFGDLIGPVVVRAMLERLAVSEAQAVGDGQLLSVGSVLHFARTGAIVWGTGVNGKVPSSTHTFSSLDVRAVRGPLTRDFLMGRDLLVPEVYGDPALLLPWLFPGLSAHSTNKRRHVTVVPNLNDLHNYPADERTLDPRSTLGECLRVIAESELVVGSSLHGIVVAEALGIPARLIEPGAEAPFKYLDYYRGTGRSGFAPAGSVTEAIMMGGEPPLDFDPAPLIRAFPVDLWGQSEPVDEDFGLGPPGTMRKTTPHVHR